MKFRIVVSILTCVEAEGKMTTTWGNVKSRY